MSLPGSGQMKHVADLFGSIEWWRLRPLPELVLNQPQDLQSYISAAASEERDLVLVYLPRGHDVKLKLDFLAPGLQGEWFSPRSGEGQPVDGANYSAPDDQDWVLVLTAGE